MVDGNFGDAVAHSLDQGGDETVHPVKGQESFFARSPHRFEGATGIADAVLGEAGADRVGEFGGEPFGKSVFAVGAVAANQVVAFVEFFEEARDVGGVVLAVAIHEEDGIAASGVDPGVHGAALAGVLGKTQDADFGPGGDAGEGGVGGFIVDEDNFEGASLEGVADFFAQGCDVVFFVIERDDDGEHGRRRWVRGRGYGSCCSGKHEFGAGVGPGVRRPSRRSFRWRRSRPGWRWAVFRLRFR